MFENTDVFDIVSYRISLFSIISDKKPIRNAPKERCNTLNYTKCLFIVCKLKIQ